MSGVFSYDADGPARLVATIEVSDAFANALWNEVQEEGFMTRIPRSQVPITRRHAVLIWPVYRKL